jgi:hypothetical protein
MQWQYRAILFEFTKDGLLGDKYVDDEEMEKTLNQMGRQGWELVNVTLLQDGVLAFLKMPVQQEWAIMESAALGGAVPSPSAQPAAGSRHAVGGARTEAMSIMRESFPEPEIEVEPARITERSRKTGMRYDSPDSIGNIRIS